MNTLKRIPLLRRTFEISYTFVVVIILSIIGGLILAFPVMWLWNYVFNKVPSVHLNVFQAWALNILTGILFGKTSSDSSKR
ncbi:TPA: hypothetical protein HA361_02810 [Candidatus Woesearchaeota archaeon]|nr:hypothetical protein [Candidatus Woesearchaeota archaeon]HII68761.1 hypothetical protein [Candidatus Woesearchaeota archaeon]